MQQLSRLFSNLLENPLKYTGVRGRVALFLESKQKFAVVRVEDTQLSGVSAVSLSSPRHL